MLILAIIVLASACGIGISVALGRRLLRRVAVGSLRPDQVERAGKIAGAVASLPAVLLAAIIGGNLGAAMAFEITGIDLGATGSLGDTMVFAVGIAIGLNLTLIPLMVGTMISAAVFMKTYLARSA